MGKPEVVGSRATFNLDLDNIYQCMVTRVVDRSTGRRVFYHRVVVEYGEKAAKDAFLVKCDSGITPLNKTAALFNEFGSARFVNYESSESSTHLPLLPLILAITAVLAMLR